MHCSARWAFSRERSGSDMRDDSWVVRALAFIGVLTLVALVSIPVFALLWSIGFGVVW